jgi:transaldolase/glucose-6-phosphate isomerase
MPGLLPAALADIDTDQFARSVHDAAEMFFNLESTENNDAVQLGVKLSAQYREGKRKLVIHYPKQLSGIAEWISELVAESTSKNGKGFISILGSSSGAIKVQKDSIYILLGKNVNTVLDKVPRNETDQVIVLKEVNEFQVGREIIRWGLAILTFCYLNSINPFIEPQFNELMSRLKENLAIKKSDSLDEYAQTFEEVLLKDLLLHIAKDDYFTIQVFYSIDEPAKNLIRQIQDRIQYKFQIPCIVCFGTKYMHSIGQQFKGGPNNGVFLQLIASGTESVGKKIAQIFSTNWKSSQTHCSTLSMKF